MKKYLLILLLLRSIICVYAQQPFFELDSIPTDGVLLNKNWKLHSGDNPQWASPSFNDSSWETIDPTQDIMSFPQLDKSTVSWLRLKIKIDSSLKGKTFALSVRQTGATQFFLNGKMLKQFGTLSEEPSKVVGYDPMGKPIGLPFSDDTLQYLAIRFAKADIFLIPHFYAKNPLLRLEVSPIESILDTYDKSHRVSDLGLYLSIFKAGIFLLFALLHLWLYNYFSSNKSNLYFSIWSFLCAAGYTGSTITFYIYDLQVRNSVTLLFAPLYPVVMFVYYNAFVIMFQVRKGKTYKIITIFLIASFPMMFRPYAWGWVPGVLGASLVTALAICKITWSSYKAGDRAALVIMICEVIYCTLIILSSVFVSLPIEFESKTLINHIIYNTGILAPPLGLSYYLATVFELNRKSLTKKLVEVQTLSLEKEGALLRQNAELQAALLQGQTTERKRVAADLHDNLGSSLTALGWSLEAINSPKLDSFQRKVYDNLRSMLNKAHTEVRLLSHSLLPEELQKQGLQTTLENFIESIDHNNTIHFSLAFAGNFPRLSPKIEFELYSICLELINNMIKHAQASEGNIDFELEGNKLTLTVSDNGRGLKDNAAAGMGLKNITERVESLNGAWKVTSTEGNGLVNVITLEV